MSKPANGWTVKRSANRANKQSIFVAADTAPTAEVTAVLSQENYQTILDEKALADWIERLKAAEVLLLILKLMVLIPSAVT